MAKRKPPRPSESMRVLDAIRRGHWITQRIALVAQIPPAHVHSNLMRLRKRGLIAGHGKTLRVIAEPPAKEPTQTERVLEAVRKGLQHAPEIAQEADVPLLNVHPLLSLLRRQGRIEGYAGSLRFLRATLLPPEKRPTTPKRHRNGPRLPDEPPA